MELKFQIGFRSFSLNIGRLTPWFEQVWFIALYEEEYINKKVVWARILWTAFEEVQS